MGKGIKFNVIYVIQSLAQDERQTGSEIALQIRLACIKRGIEPLDELIPVENRASFFEAIEAILESIKDGARPYIHFEMHGSPAGGLSLSNGEHISWQELKEPMREINIACANNLYVSLATCHGANFLDMYKGELDKPCPFFGYIGADKEVNAVDFESSFTFFFQTLLTEDNLTNAIMALMTALPDNRANYIFIDCHDYHKLLMEHWDNEYGSIAGRIKYSKYLQQRAIKEYPHIKKSNRVKRRELDRLAFGSHLDDLLVEWKKIFLHEIPRAQF